MTELSVIIVVYTEFDLLARCIESVLAQKIPNAEIIVVQNFSTKSGIEKVLKKYPQVRHIQNEKNLGFGQAVQVGMEAAKAEFILVLTPDTLLLPATVIPTLYYIQNHPRVGLVGCRVYSGPDVFNRSAFFEYPNLLTHLLEYNVLVYKVLNYFWPKYIPTLYSEAAHHRILHPKHMVGAYMLLSKKGVLNVGGFSSHYFLYREETDLCKRLYEGGWDRVYVPIGGVMHSGDGAIHQSITQSSPHYLRSVYIFFKIHYGFLYAFLAWLVGILSALISLPFLALLYLFKVARGKESTTDVLESWWKILVWHLQKGISVLISG